MLGSLPRGGRILRVVYVDVLLDTFLELDRFDYSDELLHELSRDGGELVIDVCTPNGVVSDAGMSIDAFEAFTEKSFARVVREARRDHIDCDTDAVLRRLEEIEAILRGLAPWKPEAAQRVADAPAEGDPQPVRSLADDGLLPLGLRTLEMDDPDEESAL